MGPVTSPTMVAAPRPELVRAITPEEPPPDTDPASEELEEASFFIEQGVFEEAREILETVQLAYPGNKRALELLAQLEAKEKGAASEGAEAAPEPSGDSSFDLAQELADELGDTPSGEAAPLGGSDDGFQIAAEDVFAEFKKGVSKVVKPEDVDTHYDLGIAYKEMGLFNDAIGEFEQAMKGAVGKPREVDCHQMVATCKQLQNDPSGAIASFTAAHDLPQTTPEQAKSLQFDIAATYEGMGRMGKALAHYLKVAEIDLKFRDVDQKVAQLQGDGAEPEPDDDPPKGPHLNGAKKPGSSEGGPASAAAAPADAPSGKPASRKIGYV
jgi:tetratricopeptide (TPR) repeat protein